MTKPSRPIVHAPHDVVRRQDDRHGAFTVARCTCGMESRQQDGWSHDAGRAAAADIAAHIARQAGAR